MHTLKTKIIVLVTIFTGLLFTGQISSSYAQTSPDGGRAVVDAPGTELWEAVRRNNLPLYSQVDSADGGTLIYTDGMAWLKFRSERLMPYFGYALGGTLLAILAFWLLRRSIGIPGGESGKRIQRTIVYERVVHWTMTGAFLLLAVTGFMVLYGRTLLIPIMGIETYGVIAATNKTIHNWVGLVFPVTILLMFLQFVGRNLYARGDMTWLAKGGGIVTDAHQSAGYFNMGEKILFWLVMLFGLLISITGLILYLPIIEFSRADTILAYKIHGIIAGAYVILITGHIYLAVVGVKGTLSSMTDGTVDENWAKAHHDRWYKEMESE
jgi:formate dehydrogenase subunit gamma